MGEKRKWERDYEKYSTSTELDERLEELEGKLKGVKPRERTVAFEDGTKTTVEKDFKYVVRQISKEEYDEYKKLTAIKNNLPKVKNILDKRGKLDKEMDELKDEISKREEVERKEKENQKLETEMVTLQQEAEQLEKENVKLKKALQANNLTDKQIETVNKRISENEKKLQVNMQKRQENNVKFGNNHEILSAKKAEKEKNGKFAGMSLEDLKNELIEKHQNRSMCNRACKRLMQGYSWQSVEDELKKFENEKLTAKGVQAKKMQQNRAAAKTANEKGEKAPEQEQPAKTEPAKTEPAKVESAKVESAKVESEKEEMGIAELTGWQKFKNAIKKWWESGFEEVKYDFEIPEVPEKEEKEEKASLWQKLINVLKRHKESSKAEPAKVETEKTEPTTAEPEKTQPESKHDKFTEYLKFVAENGVDKDPAEQAKEDEINQTIQRLIENKKIEATKKGEKVTKTQLKTWEKTARKVAENSYNRKHPAKETAENEGPEIGE